MAEFSAGTEHYKKYMLALRSFRNGDTMDLQLPAKFLAVSRCRRCEDRRAATLVAERLSPPFCLEAARPRRSRPDRRKLA